MNLIWKKFVPVLLALPVFAGCVSGRDEASSMLTGLIGRSPSGKNRSSQSFRFDMMPVKKGQFAQYLVTRGNENLGVRFEALGEGDMAYSQWLEVEVLTERQRTIVRTLILLDDARLAVAQRGERFEPVLQDFTRIVRARVWESGDESSRLVEPDSIAGEVKGWGDIFLLKNLKVSGRETLSLRAGKFKCHKGTSSEVQFLGPKGAWKLCLESQVPLNGFVEAHDPAGGRWELVDFGVGGSGVPVPDVFP